MTSSGRLREFKPGPLYFFDQPTRKIKRTRSNILHFSASQEGSQLEETISNRETNNKEGKEDELPDRLAGDMREHGEPDPSSAALNTKDHDHTEAYKRAAPRLLNELAELLSQHEWRVKGCVPHGVVNILNYTWHDLAAGAVCTKSPEQTYKGSVKSDDSCLESASDKEETGKINSCVVRNSERKPQVRANPRVKKRKQNSKIAHDSTTISFSISSNSCEGPGWIVQSKQPSSDEPQQMSLCQWVVERLHTARNPEKLQAAEQNQNTPLLLRHYGGAKAKPKDRRAKRKAQPATLVFGIPQIPKVKQQHPAKHKLHYRINDGSSFIYYSSGCMAVCQSHSGLPCGGFYTNVFSDSQCPAVLATITAFGHGAVTHPRSSTITATWDQDGGFMLDHLGNIIKEWKWKTDNRLRGKIVIQLSDLISVTLFSGTSAMLSFRCNNESVQLPLSALSNVNASKEMPCLQTDGKFTSDAVQDLMLALKSKSPAESKRNLTRTPVGLSLYCCHNTVPTIPNTVALLSKGVLQMAGEMERLEEPSAQWRRGGHAGRELKRLQQRVRNSVDGWLAYYRTAVGIKCPDTKRMPDAPLRTRLRREVQSAALAFLNPPEWTDAKPLQPEDGRSELKELHRHLSARAEGPPDASMRLLRTSKKQVKEESHVTQIGPLQIYGNVQLESVIIPKNLKSQPSTVRHCPAPPSLTPSIPLTVCPVLLRAALLGDGRRRRCCCSSTQMPVVTDLEYDAFMMGQPPHSQQILVVCVTLLHQPINAQAVPNCQEALEQLYRRRNKHRTMPCTQSHTDSFRLVRYEITAVKHGSGVDTVLLQKRHNAAPGMVLMYIRGKLLFLGYIFRHSCSVIDLQKQISRSRADYRLGLSLPPDYKFSDTLNMSANTHARNSQDVTLAGDDVMLPASGEQEKASDTTITEVTKALRKQYRAFCIKTKETPGFPHVQVITH